MKLSGPKKVTADWIKLVNEEPHDWQSLPHIIRVMEDKTDGARGK
jgi:hypothetical protein